MGMGLREGWSWKVRTHVKAQILGKGKRSGKNIAMLKDEAMISAFCLKLGHWSLRSFPTI